MPQVYRYAIDTREPILRRDQRAECVLLDHRLWVLSVGNQVVRRPNSEALRARAFDQTKATLGDLNPHSPDEQRFGTEAMCDRIAITIG